MKKLLSLILASCLLFNSAVPAFSAGNGSRAERSNASFKQKVNAAADPCDTKSMLKDDKHPGWHNLVCWERLVKEINQAQNKTTYKNLWNSISESVFAHEYLPHFQELIKQGKREDAKKYDSVRRALYNALGIPFNSQVCIDARTGERFPCPKNNNSGKPSESARNAPSGNGMGGEDSDIEIYDGRDFNFCFGVGEGTPNPELENRIRQLARLDKNNLYQAINLMAFSGSGAPSDPNYVHPLILKAAFFLYAKQITAAEQIDIERYLNSPSLDSDIDPALASSVSLAAASALFAFAKQNSEAIEAKFPLSSSYGTVQNTLLVSGVMVGSLTFWELVAAEAEAMGGEVAVSAEAFAASVQATAATAAKTGVAVVSSAELGVTACFIAGVGVFVYALNDAYSPGYKALFQRAKERFWNGVFSTNTIDNATEEVCDVEVPTQDEDFPACGVLNVVSWSDSYVKIGARSVAGTYATTQQQKEVTCAYQYKTNTEKWNLRSLESYVNSADSLTKAQLNVLYQQLVGMGICPRQSEIGFKKCQSIVLSSRKDIADFIQLDKVRNVKYSFVDSIDRKTLFVRAVYRDGLGWIPEAETAIKSPWGIQEFSRILAQELLDVMLDKYSQLKDGIFNFRDGARYRLGDHEKKRYYDLSREQVRSSKRGANSVFQHFHYEDIRYYPKNNPYVCNHSIFYPI